MQRPGGQGTAFSIDSLIGTPPPRSGHLLYTGYPMFMPYRPLVLPQALSHAPLQSGLPPLAPLASFAGRLTNTFCASLGQAVPSMVALTTALPSFSEPPDGFYPPQELPPPRATPDAGCRRGADGLEAEELPPGRDKGPAEPPLHFPEPFPGLAGKSGAGPSCPAQSTRPASPGDQRSPGETCPAPLRRPSGTGTRRAGRRRSQRVVAAGPALGRTPGPARSTEPIPLRPGPGWKLSRMGAKLRLPRPGRGAGGAGERPVTGTPRRDWSAAARGRGRTGRTELSEVLALGPGRGRRKVAGRPTSRSGALPARADLGSGPRPGPVCCGAGLRLVPSLVRRPGQVPPASPRCDHRLSKVSPEPAPQGDGGAGPAARRPPQPRSSPSCPPRRRLGTGSARRRGQAAAPLPGSAVRTGTAPVGVLAFVRCDRSPSAPAAASETCCSAFLSQVQHSALPARSCSAGREGSLRQDTDEPAAASLAWPLLSCLSWLLLGSTFVSQAS